MSTTTITVTGMSCGGCASSVRAELTTIPGIVDVDIDLSNGRVTIDSEAPVDSRGDPRRGGRGRLPAGGLTAVTVIAKVAAFAAVLVAVFAISVWVGGTFGPHPDIAVPHHPVDERAPARRTEVAGQ